MSKRRNFFGFFSKHVFYFKELRPIAGSVPAAILMSQMEYWFEKYPDGFYKFLEPAEKNQMYKKGKSWTEELAFSAEEFRTAFDRIGVRYKSKKEFDEKTGSKFETESGEKFYCSYHDKIKGATFYFRNENTDAIIDEVLNLRNSTIPVYGDGESRVTELGNPDPEYYLKEINKESKKEINKEREGEAPHPTVQIQNSNGASEGTSNGKTNGHTNGKAIDYNAELVERPENFTAAEIRNEAGQLAEKFVEHIFAPRWLAKMGEPYIPTFGDASERALAHLIETCITKKINLQFITKRMQCFFESDIPYYKETRYSLRTFCQDFNTLTEPKRPKKKENDWPIC